MGAAGLLLMTPRLRNQAGATVRGGPLPVAATVLSLLTHVLLGVAIVLAAAHWRTREGKTYVVNLVPAVAAVGRPEGRPSLPPRTEDAPRPAPKAAELPERTRPLAPEPPSRTASLPDRALPERALPPRAPGMPRASEKELPPTASAPRPSLTDVRAPSLGQRSGAAQGAGAVTVTAADFPFAWYIAAVQRKIETSWNPWAQPGRQPVAVFAIDRDGRVSGVAIDQTSGNTWYDQKALRAINDAVPFPPLPAEWPKPVLTIKLGFTFAQDRG